MKKRLIITGLVLLGAWLFILPKLKIFLVNDGDVFEAIHSIRKELKYDYEITGEVSADLSGIHIPDLGIYSCAAGSDRAHWHWRVNTADIRPGFIQPLVQFEYGHGRYGAVQVGGDFGGGRDKIPLYRNNKGIWISAIQPMKPGKLRFWFVADGDKITEVEADINYLAPEQAHVWMVPPEITGEDSGEWIYDPESGWVFLDCSGVDMKHRRHWWKY